MKRIALLICIFLGLASFSLANNLDKNFSISNIWDTYSYSPKLKLYTSLMTNKEHRNDVNKIGLEKTDDQDLFFEDCLPITDVTICAGSESATMDWEIEGGLSWEIAIETTNIAAPDTENIIPLTLPSYEAIDLEVNSTYYFFVRTVCSSTDKSAWKKVKFITRVSSIIEAEPFCAGPEGIVFPNVNGPRDNVYGTVACLNQTPNPVWYFLKIETAGDLIFQIIQNTQFDPDGNPIGTPLDVDFVAFGPFDTLEQACAESVLGPCPAGVNCRNNTTNAGDYPTETGNVVDCSYSGNAVETMRIINAQVGQLYAVLITNFGESPGFIKLQQTNEGQDGAGSTDCSFLYEIDLGEDLTIEGENALCPGATHLLDTELEPTDYSFQWTKDGVNIPGANGPSYLVTETGSYGLKIVTVDVEAKIYNHPDPIQIEFFDSIILEHDPVNLTSCTAEGQGVIFNLSEALEGVTFNNVGYKYYLSESDADLDENALVLTNSMYHLAANLTTRTIWVRIKSALSPCYVVKSFTIKKEICEVELVPLNDLTACGVTGVPTLFDLTVYNDVVYHGLPGYTVSYHLSEAGANANLEVIPAATLTVYEGTHNQQIWVRVTKTDTPSVYKYTSFGLKIFTAPVINANITPLYACVSEASETVGFFNLNSKDNEIKQSASGLIVEYYLTEAEAIAGDPATKLPGLGYNSESATIYVRVYSPITGCFTTGSFELIVSNAPVLNPVGDLEVCSADGYYTFNLTTIAQTAIGNASLNTFNYSFYRTHGNAVSKENALPGTSYTNVVPGAEVVYIRVENKQTKCFTIQAIGLKVGKNPVIASPGDFVLCDSNGNGVANFDLTSKAATILNGLDSALYSVRYYSTMPLAQAGNTAQSINNPSSYSNLTSNYVYIRVEDLATGCFSIVSMKLVVKPMPTVPGVINDYIVCDSQDNDGLAEFVFQTKKQEILNGNVSLSVRFYVSEADAIAGIDALNETSYVNTTAHMQTVYVRVTDIDTGCFIVQTMDLIVNPYPVFELGNQGEVSVCTSSNNSLGVFNLVQVGQDNVVDYDKYTITFYETLTHATQGVNHIVNTSNYSNVGVNGSSVWVRIVRNDTGCVGIYEIVLRVYPAPSLPTNIPQLTICDNYGDLLDGKGAFDLTSNDVAIMQEVSGTDYAITYYKTQANAQAGVQSIESPTAYHNLDAEETIWFRLLNTTTGCFSVGSFNLKVNVGLTIVKPSDISVCSDLSIGQNKYAFDLRVRNDEILGGTPIFGATFSYYKTEADALSETNAIANEQSYINTSSVENIWVVVASENGCRSITTLVLRVYAMPEPNPTPAPLQVCETEFGLGEGVFNLSDSISDIILGDANLVVGFYETESDAFNQENEILEADREEYEAASGSVYVRVDNKLTGVDPKCFVIVELKLVVNELPYLNPITPLVACIQNHPEFYEFNLSDKNVEILDGRSADQYSVKYFFNEEAAEAGTPALAYTYVNTTALEQNIWARIENKQTGCFNIAEMTIKIEERLFAFPIENPAPYCDDNDDPANPLNDGFTRINLTEFSAAIIGEQVVAAGALKVDYYASLLDYQNDNPIAAPTQFVNTSNPQTIVAVVRNRDVKLLCEEYTTFEVTVNKRPEVIENLQGGYVCMDEKGNPIPFLIDSKLDDSLYDFVWKRNGTVIGGASNSYYEATQGGTYTVSTISKETGCESFNSASVLVEAIGAFTVTIEEEEGNRDVMSESGVQTIIVNVSDNKTPTGVYEYALNDGDYQDSNIFYGVEAGDHLIWVRDKVTGACAVSTVASVMNYPKYFTPNGDGFHDTWNISGLKGQPNAKIYIFDRFGKLLKQLSPVGEGWDGTFGGRPMPSTDYWFTVEYNDFQGNRREFKGHFSLKR